MALVYRGPESVPGCPEAAAELVRSAPGPLRAVFCGPDEEVPLTAASLAGCALYVQPGGGGLEQAWGAMRRHADDIRAYVHGGGGYLGICLGGYLAGRDPGFGLLSGQIDQYVVQPRAAVRGSRDTVTAVNWRDERRHLYFQDGPCFTPRARDHVLATYEDADGDTCAALVARYGSGRVGVVGPHPEADRQWYDDEGLPAPDRTGADLGHDLLRTTLGPL